MNKCIKGKHEKNIIYVPCDRETITKRKAREREREKKMINGLEGN